MRSVMMFEEFWASRCDLSWCLRSFGRHGALSHDVGGVLGVTARSLMMFDMRSFGRHGALSHDV